jgi:hypothetical protein
VTLAVCFYFTLSLFSQQFLPLRKKKNEFDDYYFPFFLFLEVLNISD